MTTTKTRPEGGALDGLVRPFGVTSAALFTAFAGFQTALALGAPWGDHVWGGAFTEVLPVGMRFASAAAAIVLIGMATTVLARANIIQRFSRWRPLTGVTWGISGYMALNTLGNLASAVARSPARRAGAGRLRRLSGSSDRPTRRRGHQRSLPGKGGVRCRHRMNPSPNPCSLRVPPVTWAATFAPNINDGGGTSPH